MAHTQPECQSPSPSPPPSESSPAHAPGTPRKPDILRGWIKTARDAMLVLEATRAGIVPRVTRRFHEVEKRSIIQSGAIFVFTEEESGIKRWTDPHLWTASRMQGCFLMYREREDARLDTETSPYRCSAMAPLSDDVDKKADKELEHYILGSWNTGKGLKKHGLMKKTISISIEDTTYHLISYYYPSDVRSGLLQTPSSMPEFASLEITSATKIGFSQTRTLHVGRGKRGRPSRQIKKEASDGDSGESLPPAPLIAPTRPADVSPSRARTLSRHPSLTPSVTTSSSRSSSPRRRYQPYPKLNMQYSPNPMLPPLPNPSLSPHTYSGSPVPSTSPTPTAYELTPSPCDTSPPYTVWQGSPSEPVSVHPSPVLPVYDIIPYPPAHAAYHSGIRVESCHDATYQHQVEVETYDPEAQQRFVRSWEPVMDETRLMMSGQRPVPQVLSYEAYAYYGPDTSAYY